MALPLMGPGDCIVDLMTGPNLFTLAATFADGSESSHSAPFLITPTVVQIK